MIAIHKQSEDIYFCKRWIDYCEENAIPYRLVNAFSDDFQIQLKGCTAFLWHYTYAKQADMLVAPYILNALERSGIKVFPNLNTSWFFDNKIAQKYLFDSIGVVTPNTHIFYDKAQAISFINNVEFPLIFKLKNGAGSNNVRLIKNIKEAKEYIRTAFKRGFKTLLFKNIIKDRKELYNQNKISWIKYMKIYIWCFLNGLKRDQERERGYVYFQEYLPENTCDKRIIVIGDKAFGITRETRTNDFRASGSGKISYNDNQIDIECIRIAFDLNKKINTQSLACDFVLDKFSRWSLLEISYGFDPRGYDKCEGYWDSTLKYHKGSINPYGWMIENLILS